MWTWLTRWARARDTPRSRNGGPATSGSGTRRRCARRWVTRGWRSTTTPWWSRRRSGSCCPRGTTPVSGRRRDRAGGSAWSCPSAASEKVVRPPGMLAGNGRWAAMSFGVEARAGQQAEPGFAAERPHAVCLVHDLHGAVRGAQHEVVLRPDPLLAGLEIPRQFPETGLAAGPVAAAPPAACRDARVRDP